MAAPIRYHQGVSRQLSGKFFNYFEGNTCKFYAAPFDVRLYNRQKSERANKNIYSVIQPDICVVCDLTKLDRNGCLGAPDLMVEILSPGNSKKEMQTKYNLYEENGVREYWIVSPEHEYIAQYVLQANGKYAAPEYFFKDDAMPAAIFPDLILELEKVFID
jgi:Uma2 family endonuclease